MTGRPILVSRGKAVYVGVDPAIRPTPEVERLCEDYRRRDGNLVADGWLEELGLPGLTWGVETRSGKSMWLRRWRRRGRWSEQPVLFYEGDCFSAAVCTMVAEALAAWGRPVPTELAALASTALSLGHVRWQAGYPP